MAYLELQTSDDLLLVDGSSKLKLIIIEGWTWGEESPSPESPIAWSEWEVKETGADARDSGDWGKLQLLEGEEFVSGVKDTETIDTRFMTITTDDYDTGTGSVTIQWRGRATIFLQDDDEVDGPSWEEFSGSINKDWRYIQIKVTG